jgi:ATP-dependent Lhr-like helicase
MFLSDLLRESRLLPAHVEDGLGELVSRGLVTADGFAGLRQLISDVCRSSARGASRGRPGLLRQRGAPGSAGRWSLWRADSSSEAHSELGTRNSERSRSEVVEQWAWQLLRRWGVVFKDLLTRESGAPSWWELLQVYRRLEARGEIRGGRFISGLAGEQFSMSESIRQLRLLRDGEQTNEFVLLSAADPLNLVGILDDQPRVPSIASHRLVYLNGHCVGTMIAEEKWLSPTLNDDAQSVVADLLERGRPGENSVARPKEPAASERRAVVARPRAAGHARTR